MTSEFRKHLEEIISVSDEEFEQVSSFFTPKRLKKHQFLIQSGDLQVNDHFVIKGLLKAYYTNDEGKEHIIQFAMENWWITDYQAFFKGQKSFIEIDCIEDCDLLCISFENKEKLCREMHKVEHFFRVKSNFGFASLQRRILSLLDKDAKGRLEEFTQLYPTLLQRIPKTILASYLGVTRETLSRLS